MNLNSYHCYELKKNPDRSGYFLYHESYPYTFTDISPEMVPIASWGPSPPPSQIFFAGGKKRGVSGAAILPLFTYSPIYPGGQGVCQYYVASLPPIFHHCPDLIPLLLESATLVAKGSRKKVIF